MYESIAWIWGYFSPPTKVSVHSVIEVAKALLEKTPPGKKSLVCILPSSSGYKKGSVRYPCIRHAQRWKLCEALLQAVKEEAIPEIETLGRNPEDIEFRLFDYEYKSKVHIPAYQSLDILKSLLHLPKDFQDLYIVFSQEYFEEIMHREWMESDTLLRKYKHILFPRGYTTAEEIVRENLKHLLSSYSEKQRSAPFENQKEVNSIVDSMIFLGAGLNDLSSENQVRRIIQTKGYSKSLLAQYLPDNILQLILRGKPMFSSPECEKRPTSKTSREPKNKNRKTRTQLKKKGTKV